MWSVHPAYGGSHYGIKPLSPIDDVPDTSDVTMNDKQIKTHEIPDKHDKKKKEDGPHSSDSGAAYDTTYTSSSSLSSKLKEATAVESHTSVYFWMFLTCLVMMMMMMTYICHSIYHKQYSHGTHSISQHYSDSNGYFKIPDTNI